MGRPAVTDNDARRNAVPPYTNLPCCPASSRTESEAKPLPMAKSIARPPTLPLPGNQAGDHGELLLLSGHASGWRGNVQRQLRVQFRPKRSAAKPSSSSCAQAITCGIVWPSFSRATSDCGCRGCRSAPRYPATPRLPSGWAADCAKAGSVVIDSAGRRLDLLPHLEVEQSGIGREVVAFDGDAARFNLLAVASDTRSGPSPRASGRSLAAGGLIFATHRPVWPRRGCDAHTPLGSTLFRRSLFPASPLPRRQVQVHTVRLPGLAWEIEQSWNSLDKRNSACRMVVDAQCRRRA